MREGPREIATTANCDLGYGWCGGMYGKSRLWGMKENVVVPEETGRNQLTGVELVDEEGFEVNRSG